ncbi:hypothetical protein FBQ96_10230 [Nitrospirales bacterium NOB]|nr:hypothetical protein [Nitrospira sp. NTP2]MDL1889941.1 hypothetical protein [Nitrospirales bacterium NOB]
MRNLGTIWCFLLLLTGCLVVPAAAEPRYERTALSLSGQDCVSQRPSIGEALARMPGVVRVDLESVSDHALIDVKPGEVTAEQLRSVVAERLVPDASCRVEIMRSCISTGGAPPTP